MASITTQYEVDYPESDGRPMGETDVHRRWMIRIFDLLSYRYRQQDVYLASDLLLYYEHGQPYRFIVPDVFVVFGVTRHDRRTYQLWHEGVAPQVVFEVTSRGTSREDRETKPEIYQQIGVREYFSFDPTRDYLVPPLQGYRLIDDEYQLIEPEADGAIVSEQLDARLALEGDDLVMYDRPSGRRLLTEAESERERAERERSRAARERMLAKQERARAEQERKRADAAEAELRRLRAMLGLNADDEACES
ncbi:MAG: Uma2 family endonuclease [Planctomycetales bacterium]|nr:Uma2 family endonuclease [Planctomycetales bacterium]